MDKENDDLDVEEDIRSIVTMFIDPLVRQSQSLQLCALMAINNLLQLPANTPRSPTARTNTRRADEIENLVLCGRNLFYHDAVALQVATKSELDAIADELILKEAALLNGTCSNYEGGPTDDSSSTRVNLSYWEIFRSHHRTPFTGNYSFEALEAALLKRNIELECVNDTLNNHSENDNSHSVTIGFVINSVQPRSLKKPFSSLFRESRHWWTITSLRRVKGIESETNDASTSTGTGIGTGTCTNRSEIDLDSVSYLDSESRRQLELDDDQWNLIDSEESQSIQTLNSKELRDVLFRVVAEKGSIFRASIKNINITQY